MTLTLKLLVIKRAERYLYLIPSVWACIPLGSMHFMCAIQDAHIKKLQGVVA